MMQRGSDLKSTGGRVSLDLVGEGKEEEKTHGEASKKLVRDVLDWKRRIGKSQIEAESSREQEHVERTHRRS